MSDITIQWSDSTTTDLENVQEFEPNPIESPQTENDHTGKPLYMVTPARGYVHSLTFNVPYYVCTAAIVTKFESHNRDLTKKVTVFDTYTGRAYYGMVTGIPREFFANKFPTKTVRLGIAIAVEREGTYTGTAGPSATISWLN